MIKITDAALQYLNELNTEAKHLRISVIGGGCSGLSYKLGWEDPKDNDKLISFGGLRVVIDPKSALYLNGLELDYKGGLEGTGFTFNNPNATKSCGCGSSFSS